MAQAAIDCDRPGEKRNFTRPKGAKCSNILLQVVGNWGLCPSAAGTGTARHDRGTLRDGIFRVVLVSRADKGDSRRKGDPGGVSAFALDWTTRVCGRVTCDEVTKPQTRKASSSTFSNTLRVERPADMRPAARGLYTCNGVHSGCGYGVATRRAGLKPFPAAATRKKATSRTSFGTCQNRTALHRFDTLGCSQNSPYFPPGPASTWPNLRSAFDGPGTKTKEAASPLSRQLYIAPVSLRIVEWVASALRRIDTHDTHDTTQKQLTTR